MNVNIPRDILVTLLSLVNPITGGRTTLPALSCVRMTAAEGVLKIQATNLDVTVEVESPVADMAQEGAAVFSGKRLEQLLKASSVDSVSLQTQKEDVKIGIGGTATIRGLPLAEWPDLSSPNGETSITLPQLVLRSLLEKTAFSICSDQGKPVLMGAYVEGNKTLRVVSTDGRRITVMDSDTPADGFAAIIPMEAVQRIIGVLGNGGDATLSFSDNVVSVKAPGVSVTSKLIEATFPNYRQVVPERSSFMPIARKPLISILGRVILFAEEKQGNLVRLSLSDGKLELSAGSESLGDMKDKMDVAYAGKPMTIAVNGEFLMSALKAVDAESMEFSFETPQDPIMIRSGSWSHVLMPLRVA